MANKHIPNTQNSVRVDLMYAHPPHILIQNNCEVMDMLISLTMEIISLYIHMYVCVYIHYIYIYITPEQRNKTKKNKTKPKIPKTKTESRK